MKKKCYYSDGNNTHKKLTEQQKYCTQKKIDVIMKKAKKGYKELFVIATGDYLKKKIRQYASNKYWNISRKDREKLWGI